MARSELLPFLLDLPARERGRRGQAAPLRLTIHEPALVTVFAARVAVVLLVVSVVAVVAVALVAVAMIAVVIAIAIAARAAGDRHVGSRPSECDARPGQDVPLEGRGRHGRGRLDPPRHVFQSVSSCRVIGH